MEDPGEEWEIEYATSGEEVSQSKISWILSRGLWLGKKIVITGVVVSSAPLVLPSLVVVSAVGFAVSVPFGVAFASYTCTEKLMSKLLPMPQSSGMLDYGPLVMDKGEEHGSDEGEFAVEEREEKRQIQDTKGKEEMRIDLLEGGTKKQQKENRMPVTDPNSLKDSGKEAHENFDNDEALKEKGHDKGLLGGTNIKIEGRGEDFVEESLIKESEVEKPQPVAKRVVLVVEEEKKNVFDVKKTCEVVVVSRPVHGRTESAVSKSEEAEVLKAESTGLVEKARDQGISGESPVKKNKKKNKHSLKKSLGLGGKKKDESAKDTKEREKISEIRHENLNKVTAGTDRPDSRPADEITPKENRNIEVTDESKGETIEDTALDDREKAQEADEPKGKTIKDAVLDDRENAQIAEMTVGSQSILINGNRSEEKPNFVSEEVNPVVQQKQASQGLEMDKAVVSNEREAHVSDESNAIPRECAGNDVPLQAVAAIASTEISPREKNLWEQITAIRIIVGYKAAHQPSFTEELKALYVFTGVVPPSSFEDSANIGDAEEKLRFLMSIVGVK